MSDPTRHAEQATPLLPFDYCLSSASTVQTRQVDLMKPMFLPGVERNPQPGPYRSLIEQMQQQSAEYPQIWHLFAFLPSATVHLARFTQEILRGPSPLSPGLRELIAAYTSQRNHCPF